MERIKTLRTLLNLNQEEFGARIGITGGAVSKIEKGKNNLTEQTILAICREFRVDYNWLTQGIGEPFIETPDAVLDELAIDYDLTDLEKKLLEAYLNLSKEERAVFTKYIDKVLGH